MRTAWLIAALVWPAVCSSGSALEHVYTSTKCVTGIAALADGTVVASTRGGMLVRSSDGAWRKYTMADGLPANEALGAREQGGQVVAWFCRDSAKLQDGRWVADPNANPPAPLIQGQICSARWKEADCAATAEGLRIRQDGRWKSLPMPQSTGTHISALLDKGEALWAAVYEDGIFAWNGKVWSKVEPALPERARAVTAMASAGGHLWIGTSRDGLWEHDGRQWKQHTQPDEPPDHNCQAMEMYQGSLYVSTLDEGLIVRTSSDWQSVRSPLISCDTPREMIEFSGCLYLRQSTGPVDRFDGKDWTKNVFSALPRKQCSVLATDGAAIYAGQWGGWSEFDGRAWTHHLDVPDLQGCQVTALLPDGDTLWIGTQGRGLAEVDRASGRVKWHDERAGLPDDTVKCLARCGDALYAGTFAGGAAWTQGESGHWTSAASELAASQVTDLQPDGTGGVYVGARTGLWHVAPGGKAEPIIGGVEVQSLLLAGPELWVGTRTGLMGLTATQPPAAAQGANE